jgi:MoxR-like ATPase
LLTRFTTPEEIFGPLSLKSLENDEYRRCTEGFLPTASIAFLDEIFKANSAILNTLLTILNERKFDNGAGRQEQCPIQCVVGASNELPESDELDALYDRFLLRKYVSPVSDDGLLKLLSLSNPGVASFGVEDKSANAVDNAMCSNGFDVVVNQLNDGLTAVHMGEDVCLLMKDLRAYMRDEHQVEVSDRRLVQATKLLRVSAITHGRMQVDLIDCMLMQHLVWKLPEQRSAVREWLWNNVTPGGTEIAQFRLLLDGLREEALVIVRNTGGDVTGTTGGREADLAVLEALRMEINRVVTALSTQKLSLERHMELLHRSSAHLWLDPSEARAMQQLLLPRAQAVTVELDEVAVLAASLKMTLLDGPSSPSNEVRLSVMESLWDADFSAKVTFTDEEMDMGMKEAKAKFDLETFRKWKRTRKKLQAATA